MNKFELVGLAGKIGTGKDFIAKKYFFPRGYRQYSLAWHFKIDIIGKGEATWDEVFNTKPEHVRHLLQKRGTEEGRMVYGEDVWVNMMFTWMKAFSIYWGISKFIVPDVRFPNEVAGIRKFGGKVYRILAPNRNADAPATVEARFHPSETSLDNYPLNFYDGIIKNDYDDEYALDEQINRLLGVNNENISNNL